MQENFVITDEKTSAKKSSEKCSELWNRMLGGESKKISRETRTENKNA